jgi:hypothetical protein
MQKEDLGEINAYQTNLSAAWMFQKAMSAKMEKYMDSKFVNQLFATGSESINRTGNKTMKPYPQEVVRFDLLVESLARNVAMDPLFLPKVLSTVGLPEVTNLLGHVGNVSIIWFCVLLMLDFANFNTTGRWGSILCLMQLRRQ